MSRKIDALVAEHVMGLEVTNTMRLGKRLYYRPSTNTHENVPAYSTDIAAAWEVVEKLTAGLGDDGTAFNINRPWDKGHRYYYAFFATNLPWKLAEGRAVTAAMAICLAALRARGIEIPEDV